jgi:hypothetical protein
LTALPNPIIEAIDLLDGEDVEYVLIGGSAAILHGAAYVTQDVDFCCSRAPDNLDRIARALNTVNPRFRVPGLPDGLPTKLDSRTLRNRSSFAFITDIGFVDIHFSINGIGSYDAVFSTSLTETIGDRTFRILSIDGLIQCKAAIGRPRDLALIPELEMIRESEHVRERALIDERAENECS